MGKTPGDEGGRSRDHLGAIEPQEEKMGDSSAEQGHDQTSRCWQGDFPKTTQGFFMPNALKTRTGKTGEKFANLTEQTCVLHIKSDFVLIFIRVRQCLRFRASWYLWWLT